MTYPHANATPDAPPDAPPPAMRPAPPAPEAGMFARIARPLWDAVDRDAVGEIMAISDHHEESQTKQHGPLVTLRLANGDRVAHFLCELVPVRDPAVIEANRYRPPAWPTFWGEFIAMQRKLRPPRKNRDASES